MDMLLPSAYLIGLDRPVGCRCCADRLSSLVLVRRGEATLSRWRKGKGSEQIRPLIYENGFGGKRASG